MPLAPVDSQSSIRWSPWTSIFASSCACAEGKHARDHRELHARRWPTHAVVSRRSRMQPFASSPSCDRSQRDSLAAIQLASMKPSASAFVVAAPARTRIGACGSHHPPGAMYAPLLLEKPWTRRRPFAATIDQGSAPRAHPPAQGRGVPRSSARRPSPNTTPRPETFSQEHPRRRSEPHLIIICFSTSPLRTTNPELGESAPRAARHSRQPRQPRHWPSSKGLHGQLHTFHLRATSTSSVLAPRTLRTSHLAHAQPRVPTSRPSLALRDAQ